MESVNPRARRGRFRVSHRARAQRESGNARPILQVTGGFQNDRREGNAGTGDLGLAVSQLFNFGDAQVLRLYRRGAETGENRGDNRYSKLLFCHLSRGAFREQSRTFPDNFNRFGLVFRPYFCLSTARKKCARSP
jgi:hypothetical protein